MQIRLWVDRMEEKVVADTFLIDDCVIPNAFLIDKKDVI